MSARRMIVFVWISLSVLSPAARAGGEDLQDDIDGAIDQGIEYLLKAVQGPSGWMPGDKFGTGYAALQLYALVKSDVSYLHPVIQKGIGILEGYTFEKVYSVSLYVMAYDAMVEQIDGSARLGETTSSGDRSKFLDRMKAGTDWLIAARLRGMGAWNYEPVPPRDDPRNHRYDHSNTQFAVLALGVAAERKLAIPPAVWEEIANHFIAAQAADGEEVKARPAFKEGIEPDTEKSVVKRQKPKAGSGGTTARKTVAASSLYASESVKIRARGWKYVPDEYETKDEFWKRRQFSMVCAGQSSILLARRNLPPAWGEAPRAESLKTAIRDGYGWLCKYFDGNRRPAQDYYAFYSLEKVGDIGGVAAFGEFRWYEEIARMLLRLQRSDGSWRDPYREDEASTRAAAALALLFLNRATDIGAREGPFVKVTRAGGVGPGEGRGPEDRQAWVYLPSQKAEVPVARLFRLLRYRPGKVVLKLTEEAVKVYDPERANELVGPLVAAYEHSIYPPVRAHAKKLLVALTGGLDLEPKDYTEWARGWAEAVRIGKAADREEIEKLLELLSTAQGTRLKAKVVWALQRTGAREAMGKLIDLLEDKDPALREEAHSALAFLSGQSLPFHPKGNDRDRAEEVRAWREWYAAEQVKRKAEPASEK